MCSYHIHPIYCLSMPPNHPTQIPCQTTPLPCTSSGKTTVATSIRNNNRRNIHWNPIQILIYDPPPSSHPDRPPRPTPLPRYQQSLQRGTYTNTSTTTRTSLLSHSIFYYSLYHMHKLSNCIYILQGLCLPHIFYAPQQT